ncbi:hypothetical protein ACFX58_10575 [Sphingomonas sp. NCPPB 2930]
MPLPRWTGARWCAPKRRTPAARRTSAAPSARPRRPPACCTTACSCRGRPVRPVGQPAPARWRSSSRAPASPGSPCSRGPPCRAPHRSPPAMRSPRPSPRSSRPSPAAIPGGDVLRIVVEVNASAPMTWVVLSDPIPGGATILGSGLGRDSEIAAQAGKKDTVDPGAAWLAYEERSFEAFRAYYEYVPKGVFKVEYTVRLNNVGAFSLPATRVEAMYAPEMFGEVPNARVTVQAAP